MAVLDDVREAMRETNERFCLEVVGEAAPFQRIVCIHVARIERGTLAPDFSQNLPFPLYFATNVLRRILLARSKRDLVAATEMPARSAISFTDLSFD
jgi:hypothetical protein